MLTNEPELNWTPAQRAYSVWLEETIEAYQNLPAVYRWMQRYLRDHDLLDGLGKGWHVGNKTPSSAYTQWRKGRAEDPAPVPTTPDKDALQQALIAVVSDAVPQPPDRVQRLDPDGSWDTFSTVFWAVHDAKDASRTSTAKKAAEGAHSEERARKARDLTATEPVSAAELDPKALNLGSWMFGGGIPPYVARTADTQLAERLTAISTGLTVVAGPPKSGKTRSVLETLAATVSDATVQWVNPAPGVLPALVDLHRKEKNAGPGVVVLDDAQFLGVNPTDGLTAQRLTELASRSRLIVIVHEHDLGMWRNQINNRTVTADADLSRIGATPELIELLDEHRIDYHTILDDTELGMATALLEKATSSAAGLDFTRLAEALASVDHFKSEATKELAAGGIRAALIEAAVDATILYPTGADIEQLEQLCKLHYRRFRPNLPWRTSQFDDAFDWATTGYKESPHAILTRTPGSDQHYRLFDALTPALRTTDRALHHLVDLNLDDTALMSAGGWLHAQGELIDALTFYKQSAESGNAKAMFGIGLIAYGSEELDHARLWWKRAAACGDALAMLNLGVLAKRQGQLDASRGWWERAALCQATTALASLYLGMLDQEAGDLTRARTWYEQAAKHNNADAMNNLGSIVEHAGDLETAQTWWGKAAMSGHVGAMNNLATSHHRFGDPEIARTWWMRAAAHNDADSIYNLGFIAQQKRHLKTAQSRYLQAAKLGSGRAMLNLGVIAADTGDVETARTWYQKAIQHGENDAINNLGILAVLAGDVETARTWYEKAANHGDPAAMFNLGNLNERAGDKEAARTWYEKAANHGHPDAMFNAGVSMYNAGDTNSARTWWVRAAAAGSVEAQQALDETDGDSASG